MGRTKRELQRRDGGHAGDVRQDAEAAPDVPNCAKQLEPEAPDPETILCIKSPVPVCVHPLEFVDMLSL